MSVFCKLTVNAGSDLGENCLPLSYKKDAILIGLIFMYSLCKSKLAKCHLLIEGSQLIDSF